MTQRVWPLPSAISAESTDNNFTHILTSDILCYDIRVWNSARDDILNVKIGDAGPRMKVKMLSTGYFAADSPSVNVIPRWPIPLQDTLTITVNAEGHQAGDSLKLRIWAAEL